MNKKMIKWGSLIAAGLLFLLLACSLRNVEKSQLMENSGRDFERAQVVDVLQDNETQSGQYVGQQKVTLKLLTGSHKDENVEALSSAGYLFGAHCRPGMEVVAIVNESQGELVVSVYSENRTPALLLMVAVFVAVIVLIGGKKGLASVGGLFFTLLCIVFLFLPMIYKGFSPIFASIIVVAITTVVTMVLIDGVSQKSITAMAGTIIGVIAAGVFAWIFGKIVNIGGYNVPDIEDLVYVEQMTDIKIGELLFAGIIIAALGAVMDVGMSIASTLNELHAKNKDMTVAELFHSGMNVGRDMMGTMSNTLILAFTGGSINTLVFIYAYNYQLRQIFNMYSVGIEIMQGLSSSMGVILTVPFTSLIGAWLMGRKKEKHHSE